MYSSSFWYFGVFISFESTINLVTFPTKSPNLSSKISKSYSLAARLEAIAPYNGSFFSLISFAEPAVSNFANAFMFRFVIFVWHCAKA